MRLLPAALFVLALAPRLVFWAEWNAAGVAAIPVVDAASFDREARLLRLGAWPGPDPFWQAPLYSCFLGGVYALTGAGPAPAEDDWAYARAANAALGALTCVLVWALARRWMGARWALAAFAACALYGPLLYFEGQLLRTTLAAFLLTAWGIASVRRIESPASRASIPAWALCGALLGLAALTRENALLLLPLAAAAPWFAAGESRRRPGSSAAVVVLAFVLVLAPVTLFNAIRSGELVPVSTSGGVNLYIGNNPQSARTLAIRPGTEWERLTHLPLEAGAVTETAKARWFAHAAISWAAAEPVSFAANLLRKTASALSAHEIPRNQDLYAAREESVLLRALLWRAGPVGFPFGWIAPLAAAGLVLARRGGQRYLAAAILLYGASLVVVFPAARYRVPMAPLLCVVAAWGAAGLRTALSARTWPRRTIVAAGVGALVAAVSNAGIVTAVDDPADMAYLRGNALVALGRSEEAVAPLRTAVRLQPGHGDAWITLAAAFHSGGQLEEARRAARAAVAADSAESGDFRALAALGRIELETGNPAAAADAFERALRTAPWLAQARVALAEMQAASGAVETSRRTLREGLELDPREGRLWLALGTLEGQAGRFEPAGEAIDRAVDLRPYDPDAWNAKGLMALQSRRRDEAAAAFHRALRLDPAYGPAAENLRRFGLGR